MLRYLCASLQLIWLIGLWPSVCVASEGPGCATVPIDRLTGNQLNFSVRILKDESRIHGYFENDHEFVDCLRLSKNAENREEAFNGTIWIEVLNDNQNAIFLSMAYQHHSFGFSWDQFELLPNQLRIINKTARFEWKTGVS